MLLWYIGVNVMSPHAAPYTHVPPLPETGFLAIAAFLPISTLDIAKATIFSVVPAAAK